MDDYNRKIYTIRKCVFQGKMQEGMNLTIALIGELMKDARLDRVELQRIAKILMEAMQNKDYLLMADISYFEVPALWQGNTKDIDIYLNEEKEDGPLFGKFVLS